MTIHEEALHLREKHQLYTDIKPGTVANPSYLSDLQVFSENIRSLTAQQFAEVQKRRGVVEEPVTQVALTRSFE